MAVPPFVIKRPTQLPHRSNPVPSEVTVSDDGSSVAGVTWTDGVNAAVPVASQSEAAAGTDNHKRMTPLTTRQAIDEQVPPKISMAIANLNLGSAAQSQVQDFATAEQGTKADSAVQPDDLAAVATSGSYNDLSDKPILGTAAATDASDYATAAQGVPGGGSVGQVLQKNSPADNDVKWGTILAPPSDNLQNSKTAAQLAVIPTDVEFVSTAGYNEPGDGGGALYKRVSSEPSHAGKFQSADGAWWELAETVPNVKMFGAVGDGSADDQDAIVGAVSFARASGFDLYWPSGEYLSTASIPNFHDVIHIGPGAAKRGSGLFYVSGKTDHRNVLNVSPDGIGDGLSPATAMPLAEAFEVLAFRGPQLVGLWGIRLAAGTYPPVPSQVRNIKTADYLLIEGPAPSGGVDAQPAATIDADGELVGIFFSGLGDINIRNLRVINANGSSLGSALTFDGCGVVWLDNVWTNNTTWCGVNATRVARLIVYGGRFENSATFGIYGYSRTFVSINREDRRPVFQDCQNGIHIQGSSYGHADYCDFIRCATAISTEYESHLSSYYNYFTACNRLHYVGTNCSISRGNNTGSAGSLFDVARGGGIFTDPAKTYMHSQQYYPDYGSQGRYRYGYSAYGAPVTSFCFSRDGTVAGGDLSGMSAAVALFESNGNSIIGLASPPANFSAIWFGAGGVHNKSEIRGSGSGSLEFRLSGASKFSMRTGDFIPLADNSLSLGSASFRFSVVYAGTGTINTSDARGKDWRGGLNEAEINVAKRLSKLVGIYRWKDMIAQKGDSARLHAGVTAQDVIAAFEDEGLDPFRYGVVCYDEWQEVPEVKSPVLDESGNETGEFEITQEYKAAGNRYGVRHDELWAFVAAGFEARLTALEE